MTLKLRRLRGDDVFPVLDLINKLELIDPISQLAQGELRKEFLDGTDEKSQEQINLDVGIGIAIKFSKIAVRNIPKARDEINEFLADLTETDVKTITELPIKEYIGLVKDFFTHDDLRELLESVLQLSKSE